MSAEQNIASELRYAEAQLQFWQRVASSDSDDAKDLYLRWLRTVNIMRAWLGREPVERDERI